MVVTKARVVKTTAAGTCVPTHSIAGDAAADDAPLIDGAGSWTGVRMGSRRQRGADPPLKETKMSERLETLNKARARMIEDRDMHAKVLAAPFDRDKAERARNKFIEIQMLSTRWTARLAGRDLLANRLSSAKREGA